MGIIVHGKPTYINNYCVTNDASLNANSLVEYEWEFDNMSTQINTRKTELDRQIRIQTEAKEKREEHERAIKKEKARLAKIRAEKEKAAALARKKEQERL